MTAPDPLLVEFPSDDIAVFLVLHLLGRKPLELMRGLWVSGNRGAPT
jgi:hypothetical protein